jgi:hypothetical protein
VISSSEPGFKAQKPKKRRSAFDDNSGTLKDRRSGIGRRLRHLFGNDAAQRLYELKFNDKLERLSAKRAVE